MDLFFECAPVEAKRRVHFNKFMLDGKKTQHKIIVIFFSKLEFMHVYIVSQFLISRILQGRKCALRVEYSQC